MTGFTMTQQQDCFRWENEDLVLEFSSPSTQGYKEFVPLNSLDDIMYYYYTVRIYKKVLTWEEIGEGDEDEDEGKIIEQLVTECNTHDFPTISQLKWILTHLLADDPRNNGQKDTYQDGSVRFRKTMCTEGFGCDDFYEITKITKEKGEDERYVVYIGTSYAPQSDLNSTGIRTPYVTRNDIQTLLECVEAFIQFSIEQDNAYLALRKQSIVVKNQMIYQYDFSDEGINLSCIKNMFAAGDHVSFIAANVHQQTDYETVLLKEIHENSLTVSNGNHSYTIPTEDLAFIHHEPTKDRLAYDEHAIAEDFVSILSADEQEAFQKKSVDELLVQYGEVIINRTWLCRDEHAFSIDYNTGTTRDAVQPIVRDVISLIKNKLMT